MAQHTEPGEPAAARSRNRRLPGRSMGAVAVGALAAAAAALAYSVFSPGVQEELPPMPATAVEAFESLPEHAEEDGWRRELPDPLDKPDLVLTDQKGEPYDLRAETAGAPTLLFFGYTHCPDACPAQMAILASALDDLGPEAREQLEVVFVTVDPDRDTPERLGEWLANFDEGFVGLSGHLDEVGAAMGQLHMSEPIAEDPDEDGDYHVHHHSPVVAFHPDDDRARTMYPLGMRQEHWREELPGLIAGEHPFGE